MNWTTLEQGKKLVELGLDPNTADMFYCYGMNVVTKEWGYDKEPSVNGEELHIDIGDVPCWSGIALINLMPRYITRKSILQSSKEEEYPLLIHSRLDGGYDVEYNANVIAEIGFCYPSLMDSLYNMVVWLLDNGYIKKE